MSSGVGKTELSKALAEFLFGDEDALVQLDMSWPQTWVREHIADHVQLRTNTVGDLAFFKGVPATV